MYLEKINDPKDLLKLNYEQLDVLASEIRSFMIEHVSKTGGHLASSLGVVELTIAIHRVFDTKKDRLVFDVGHQCYPHKILTGRKDKFDSLRQYGGLSGFPKPYESVHDAFIAGHASNSISVALGMARAKALQNGNYNIISLIGDGALTGGLSYEGLNDAGSSKEPLIVILNDNGMSIDRNVGGMSTYLRSVRNKQEYYDFKRHYKTVLSKSGAGKKIYKISHTLKTAVKESVVPLSTMFEQLGFTYLGPVNGHDIKSIETGLIEAKKQNKPVLLHVMTKKGKGYIFAENEPEKFHGIAPFDPKTGNVLRKSNDSFSKVFGEELIHIAEKNECICAVSAAMLEGTGLGKFANTYPERTFDVGIAEGHAVSMCSGLAKQGMIPVFAVYSSFLQRAYDMLIHDVSLQNLHVVFGVDRAGVVGQDGETHHGMFDVTYLNSVPGMNILVPSNYKELRGMLNAAVNELKGPVAIRYPRGSEGYYQGEYQNSSFIKLKDGKDFTIVTYGTLIDICLEAVEELEKKGISVGLVKVNNLKISDMSSIEIFADIRRYMIVEDCVSMGCYGERLASWLLTNNMPVERYIMKNLGNIPLIQGKVEELYSICGITTKSIVDEIEAVQNGK